MEKEILQHHLNINRRHFLSKMSLGIGSLALGSLLIPEIFRGNDEDSLPAGIPHFAPKAKRVIYLFQSGAPSQLDLFDYKPMLNKMQGQNLPESVRMGQRLTGMTSGQKTFPLAGSIFKFQQYGECRAWVSELMPYTSKIVDDLCFVKSMYTEAINHDPAVTFFQTGNQQPGRPSMGSWLSYGLGSENKNLPAFCVFLSRGKGNIQPLASRLWGSGFLDSIHQGVQLRSAKDPVLYLQDPEGLDRITRRNMLDKLAALNQIQLDEFHDPEIATRVSQYEMAYRMQTSVPEVIDISNEPDHVFKMYGPDSMKPGTYAANCILARRLIERGVRFVQLYHMGWDQHNNLPNDIKNLAKDTDQPSTALVMDLKQRGLLEDTLVIWGGEFGRTNYCQGTLTPENYGRDHHPRCFTIWMTGAGVQPGMVYGETDDFGYNIAKDPVHVHDFQATVLNLMGLNHEKLTFRHQGRRYRLTDVDGKVVKDILA
ncbi:MAG: sulfatase [Bacteroidetes bacterium]|nr:MAG: sulfatase [Bacteroidota bacterium]